MGQSVCHAAIAAECFELSEKSFSSRRLGGTGGKEVRKFAPQIKRFVFTKLIVGMI